MGALITELLILFTAYGYIRAIMIAAPVGTCTIRKGHWVPVVVSRSECETMKGKYYGDLALVDCYLDWCTIPPSGPVATGYVWGFDRDQNDKTRSDSRVLGAVLTTRVDCDRMFGTYDGNPRRSEWPRCHMFMKRMDGSDRQNVDTIAFSGKCSPKIARTALMASDVKCVVMGGERSGDPQANDLGQCHFDVCLSPVIKCAPSDSWTTIQVCRNPSSSSFKCTFEVSIGIEKGKETSSQAGGDSSVTIAAETSVELWGIFSASLSLSGTTGFNWSNSVSSRQIWSKATTRTLEVLLAAGKSVSINQVVGQCGNYKVDTTEYKVIDI